MSTPSVPQFAAYIDAIFTKILADIAAAQAKAEASLPGSGAKFEPLIAAVTAARAAADPAAAAQLLVHDLGTFVAGLNPIVHKGSDLAR